MLPRGLPQHRCFLPRASKENLLIRPATAESSVKFCNGGMTCRHLCRVMQPNRESDSPSSLPYSAGSKQGRPYLHSWKELQKNRDTKRQKSTEGHLRAWLYGSMCRALLLYPEVDRNGPHRGAAVTDCYVVLRSWTVWMEVSGTCPA